MFKEARGVSDSTEKAIRLSKWPFHFLMILHLPQSALTQGQSVFKCFVKCHHGVIWNTFPSVFSSGYLILSIYLLREVLISLPYPQSPS